MHHLRRTKFHSTKNLPHELSRICHHEPSTHTMIKYKNGTEGAINANNFQIGAAYIKIPCDASIVEKQQHPDHEVMLVDTLTPCFQEDKPSEPWIVRTTPAQWTKYPPTEIEHGLHAIHN